MSTYREIQRKQQAKIERAPKARKIALLERAKELLSRPRGWTKHDFAKSPRGGVMPMCLGAACQRAAIDVGLIPEGSSIYATHVADGVSLRDLARDKGFSGVTFFNDSDLTRKKDVLNLIDERIAQLKGEKKK